MSARLGPRGFTVELIQQCVLFVVGRSAGEVRFRIWQASRDAGYDTEFADLRVRRCREIDHFPEGFQRYCELKHLGNGVFDLGSEDREWLSSLSRTDQAA